MLKRIISAVIGLPLLISVIFIGGTPLFLAVIISSLIGLREFYGAWNNKAVRPISMVGYLGSIIMIVSFNFSSDLYYVFLLFFLLILFLNFIRLIMDKYTFIDISITLYGVLYIPLLLSYILLIAKQPNNIVIWLVFITAWGTDTFAYFSGYFFGKKKLCPSISPKKTVEGAIGGVLGSTIVSTIFGYIFLKEHIIVIFIIGILGSIVAQIGDLSASLVKRYTGIKDFGNIMPGHGGILDRFDSILFTAPTVYYALIIFINK